MDWNDDEQWYNEEFLNAVFRVHDEATASRNPNPTPTPAPAPAPAPAPSPAPFSYGSASSAYASVSYLPATSASASGSYLPAASSPPPALRFSPPPELTQHPPRPLPPVASGEDDALAMVDRRFSPPRELSQRPRIEESDCAIVQMPGPAIGDSFVGTGGNVGAKRERDAKEVERLKVTSRCVKLFIWFCICGLFTVSMLSSTEGAQPCLQENE